MVSGNEWAGARINRLVSIRIVKLLVLFGMGGDHLGTGIAQRYEVLSMYF